MAQSGSLTCETRPDPAPLRAPLHVVLAAPRGFCAGVRRAIDAVDAALLRFGPPVYVRRAIVHNLAVVRDLQARGAVFVEESNEVPSGAVLILSAHGVSPRVARDAAGQGLHVIDAVCPLVAKVHREVVRHHRDGRHIVLIGHRDHAEIEGTIGHIPGGEVDVIGTAAEIDALRLSHDRPIAYAVQTTFSVEEADDIATRLEARFTDVVGPQGSDICYATSNRQAAVRAIVADVEAVIVVGENFSSNANRLAEVAAAEGCRSVQLVAGPGDLDWDKLDGRVSVGVTAAASTPESSVAAVLDALRGRFDLSIEEVGSRSETAKFRPVRLA